MREREIKKRLAGQLLPERVSESSKRDYGSVLVIAGTEGMMGAAVLCARAALRSGAGLVTLCCPRELFMIPQTAVPEVMCAARDPEGMTAEYLNRFSAIAFGPGCVAEKDPSLKPVLEKILDQYEGILTVDASGLSLLKETEDLALKKQCRLILTPHCAEAALLLDRAYTEIRRDRGGAAEALAEHYGAVALVKGPGTRICVPAAVFREKETQYADAQDLLFVNPTGNSGMATGGSGDVLTGIIAGLSAQYAVRENPGLPAEAAAAVLGVYLHGLAGDLAAGELGKRSLTAGDIIAYLPQAFMETEQDLPGR